MDRLWRAPTLVVFALLTLTGCGPDIIEPGFSIEGHKLLVVPFRDQLDYHYDSPRGNALARSVTEELISRREEGDEDDVIEVVPFEELIDSVREVNVKELTNSEVAKRVGADLMVIGELRRFEAHRPGDIGIRRGRAELALRVVLVDDPGGRPLLKTVVKVAYPPDDFVTPGLFTMTEADGQEVEEGLLQLLTNRTGKLFRYYPTADDGS